MRKKETAKNKEESKQDLKKRGLNRSLLQVRNTFAAKVTPVVRFFQVNSNQVYFFPSTT